MFVCKHTETIVNLVNKKYFENFFNYCLNFLLCLTDFYSSYFISIRLIQSLNNAEAFDNALSYL